VLKFRLAAHFSKVKQVSNPFYRKNSSAKISLRSFQQSKTGFKPVLQKKQISTPDLMYKIVKSHSLYL